jgi:hypothetical protein
MDRASRSKLRRPSLTIVAALAFVVAGFSGPAAFADSSHQHWVGTWGASPQLPDTTAPASTGFTDQTLRQIVRTSIGGNTVRVRFTNEIQATQLTSGVAHIALRDAGASAAIDFDEATRDPANPTFSLPAYDSGDHLHPNDVGYKAMADAIDLKLFKK